LVDLVFVYGQVGEIDLLAAAPSQARGRYHCIRVARFNQSTYFGLF
jgi:hypothetical protein